jgi:hypothetical protein
MKRTMAIVFLTFAFYASAWAEDFGSFTGDLHFKWHRDGRKMELLTPFRYIDPAGRDWNVPAGAVTDGASIPKVFWSIAAPFEGKYRDAAVVHDYYCEVRTRAWRDTHIAFYNAMRASGVDETMAKTMYGAVYYFGPRWGIGVASRGPGGQVKLSPREEKQIVDNLRNWIESDRPTLAEISNRMDDVAGPSKH